MSSFMGSASAGDAGVGPFAQDDGRLRPEWFEDDGESWMTPDDVWALDGMRSQWWPGDSGLDASGGEWCQAVWYDRIEVNSGSSGRYAFTGVTRDVYGQPIPGVTVKLFKATDNVYGVPRDTKLDETTSDINGGYTLYTAYYPDPHYIVAYKAGYPDVEGTSVNTLVGT